MIDGKWGSALLQLGIEVSSCQGTQGKKYAFIPDYAVTEHDFDVLHLIRWYVVGTTTMRPNVCSGLLTVIPYEFFRVSLYPGWMASLILSIISI